MFCYRYVEFLQDVFTKKLSKFCICVSLCDVLLRTGVIWRARVQMLNLNMRVLLHILPPFLARFDKEADETDSSADDEDDGEDDLLLGTSNLDFYE